jgi:signal peptidase I
MSASGTVPPAAPPRRPSGGLRFAVGTVVMLVFVSLLSIFVVRPYVVEPFYIPSASMEPTLHGCPGCQPDRVLVDKVTYHFRDPDRGEIVVFKRPPNLQVTDKDLIKRVIGLPGETVSGHDGSVWIGDRRLAEPYVNPACHGTADFGAVTVPAGDVFLMGDNRCDSLDSRVFGPIPESTIVGRAFMIVWPPSRVHWL